MQLRLPWKSSLYHHAAENILHVIWNVIFKVSRPLHAADGPLCVMRVNCPAAWFWTVRAVFISVIPGLPWHYVNLGWFDTFFHSICLCLACVPADRTVFKCSGVSTQWLRTWWFIYIFTLSFLLLKLVMRHLGGFLNAKLTWWYSRVCLCLWNANKCAWKLQCIVNFQSRTPYRVVNNVQALGYYISALNCKLHGYTLKL